MNRDNLSPEQRPDKTGNLVTRWVRRNKKQSAATGSIPAPGIAPTPLTDRQKRAAEIAGKIKQQRDLTPDQRDAAKAEGKRQMSFLKMEGPMRWKNRKNDAIDDHELHNLFVALIYGEPKHPTSIITEDLIESHQVFKKAVWKPFFDNRSGEQGEIDEFRPHVEKLGSHFANYPEDREALSEIVGRGVVDYDEAMKELNAGRQQP